VENPRQKVTIVSIAKAAKMPRASVLLQFPDGVPEIIEMLSYQEEESIVEIEEHLAQERRPRTGLDRAMLAVDIILSRGEAFRHLYGNLLSEELQYLGGRREFRAGLVFLGLGLLRLVHGNDATFLLTARNLALAETIARAVFHLAATSPTVMDWHQQPPKTEIVRILLEGVAPGIEADAATG
jgi:hypothetical protein